MQVAEKYEAGSFGGKAGEGNKSEGQKCYALGSSDDSLVYLPLPEVLMSLGRLERRGFRVMALTCDGLSANRRLFLLHHQTNSPASSHWVLNPYSDDGRNLFFIYDPPHLIKTVRNAWDNSKRRLWVSAVS
jgi:hypothetical protein